MRDIIANKYGAPEKVLQLIEIENLYLKPRRF